MSSRSLNVFLLTMINLATILSIRNWPLTAEYGLASIFFLLLSLLVFFLPTAFISAELATGWPERGGIFVWVREAFGNKAAFLAVWLLWVENVVWYPTILSFVAGSIAFAFDPGLASNRLYTFGVILVIFWGMTLLNLLGMKISGWISSLGVILGTLLPGILIISLGSIWYFGNNHLAITFSWEAFFPTFTHFG